MQAQVPLNLVANLVVFWAIAYTLEILYEVFARVSNCPVMGITEITSLILRWLLCLNLFESVEKRVESPI